MENKSGIENLLRINSERKLKLFLLVSIGVILGSVILYFAISYFSYDVVDYKLERFGADIDDVFLSDDGKVMSVGLSGGVNFENISRVKFLLKSSEGEYVYETEEGAENISVPYNVSFWHKLFGVSPDYKGGYGYNFSLDRVNGLSDFEDIEEVSVVFEYVFSEVNENVKNVISTPVLDRQEEVRRVVGGGGGSSGGGSSSSSSSGDSSSEVVCVPRTCDDLGCVCGVIDNGCGVDINCGSCSDGENCREGSCVSKNYTNNISQYGITWYFDREYEYGQFVNGDYWVVGPVNVTNISPRWDGEKSGSVVNPPVLARSQGYDGRENYYNDSLRVSVPIILNANDSLVSTIGLQDVGRSYLEAATVLTVLGSSPPSDAFRPTYIDGNKKIFRLSEVNQSILPSIVSVSSTPDFFEFINKTRRVWLDHMEIPYSQHIHPINNMEVYGQSVAEVVSDVALLLMIDNPQREELLINFLQIGIDLYATSLNNAELWPANGGQSSGRKWPIVFAGIMFNDEGILDLISNKSGDYAYESGYGAGNLPSDYIHFGEDDQTFYVKEEDVWTTPYDLNCLGGDLFKNGGTVSVTHGSNVVQGSGTSFEENDLMIGTKDGREVHTNFGVVGRIDLTNPSEDWNNCSSKAYEIESIDETNQILYLTEPYRGTTQSGMDYKIGTCISCIGWLWYGHGFSPSTYLKDYSEFTELHLGIPEWGIGHAANSMGDGPGWDWASYRRCCTAYVWGGYALAALILQENGVPAKTLWNHDAFFDYQDRYMKIELEGIDEEGNVFDSTPPSSLRQASNFVTEMWDTYRGDYGCIYHDLNTTAHTRIYNCSNEIVDCSFVSSCFDYPNQRAVDYDPCNLGCEV